MHNLHEVEHDVSTVSFELHKHIESESHIDKAELHMNDFELRKKVDVEFAC